MLLRDAREGGDTTLSNAQYRRVAKRLRKWGHKVSADYYNYYMEVN